MIEDLNEKIKKIEFNSTNRWGKAKQSEYHFFLKDNFRNNSKKLTSKKERSNPETS